jgi:hypothetical protein
VVQKNVALKVNIPVKNPFPPRNDRDSDTPHSGFFVAQIIYKVVLGFTKVSILVLYRRIFIGVNFRRVVNVLIALIIIWATMATVATIFQCTPIAASWDNSIPVSKCIHKNAFWYGFAVTNTFSDFVLLFLPVQPILKLRLDWRSKLAVLGVFALGALYVYFRFHAAWRLSVSENWTDKSQRMHRRCHPNNRSGSNDDRSQERYNM